MADEQRQDRQAEQSALRAKTSRGIQEADKKARQVYAKPVSSESVETRIIGPGGKVKTKHSVVSKYSNGVVKSRAAGISKGAPKKG